jgi:hypothetical protein
MVVNGKKKAPLPNVRKMNPKKSSVHPFCSYLVPMNENRRAEKTRKEGGGKEGNKGSKVIERT